MDDDVRAYLDAVTARAARVAGDRLAGAWAIGSLALGGFDRSRSDIDVQAAVEVPLSRAELRELAAALDHSRLPCPARKLEFVVYERDAAPAFVLNLNTGAGMRTHVGLDPAQEPGFWFVIDVAIAREHGMRLAGAAPAEILPELPRAQIAAALDDAVAWWRVHGSPEDVAIASARARAWASDGRWLSKAAARAR